MTDKISSKACRDRHILMEMCSKVDRAITEGNMAKVEKAWGRVAIKILYERRKNG